MSNPEEAAERPAGQAPAEAAERTASPGAAPKRERRGLGLAGAAAVIALALVGWHWYYSEGQLRELRQELARKLADAEAQGKQSRTVAEQMRETVAETQAKLGVLEGRLAESHSQQLALEALYQELSRNRDEWAYAEVEQSLLLASQQLQLAGNVKAALIALQAADARLQRLERPQLAGLRKAINRDVERLKALPHVDVVRISARLDTLIGQIDTLPLAMDARLQQESPAAAAKGPEGNAWMRLWRETWAELKQLVRVQQVARQDAPLLSPPQSYFLRENLKLRLIGARLALLARDATAYRADLKAAREWLNRYYDTRNNHVAQALATLGSLREAEVSIEVPDITTTLEALRKYRLSRERAAR